LGEIFQLAEYSSLQIILLAKYSEIWMTFGRNIPAGRIFQLAEYSSWQNIPAGRIFQLAEYSSWQNIPAANYSTGEIL
jgi:hypothetical protein